MAEKKSGIDRRSFVKSAGALAAIAHLGATGPSSRPPNVVLMIADNLGWKDLSCYGDQNLETPSIDRLAREGARFTNAFVSAPSCSPSRATIMSGQTPHSVNVLGLTHLYPHYQMPVHTPTLPGTLRSSGYFTGINGKWHVSPYIPTRFYGYDKHMGMFSINDPEPACSFIQKNKDRPFYLEMNYMQTHRPAVPGKSKAYKQHPDFPVDPGAIQVPDYYGLPDWPAIREDLAGYYSQAMWMDRIIGEVMDCLEKQGLADNTVVVFISDNGPMYPGGIGSCYDFGIGTPLIIRWPEGIPAGVVQHGLVSAIDIMPTALAAAQIQAPPCVQGSSLLAMARGEETKVHDAVYAEMTFHVRKTAMRAVRTRDYKYIRNLNDTPIGLDMTKGFDWAKRAAELPEQRCCRPRPAEELYDLSADPTEVHNLARDPDHGKIKMDLASRLAKWRKETRDPIE